MKNSFYLSLIIFLIAFNCFSQTFTDTFTTSEGHKLHAVAKVEKETIMFGETTYILFEIKNLSNVTFYTGVGGDYRNELGRPDSYSVKVIRDDGKSVPQYEIKFATGGFLGSAEIPANDGYKEKLYLPHWADFEETGNYTITIKRGFSIRNRKTEAKDTFYAEASTKIKIIPTNQDELGKVIDELGTKMLDTNKEGYLRFENPQRDAANLLKFIDDNRTIKYFAQSLEIFSAMSNWESNWDYRRLALALSKFPNDSALEALKKVMNSKNDYLRLDVADALRNSKHPNALKTLFQMQDDNYYFVRLRVVQAYGKINSAESIVLLRKMLNDKHESVREEAKEFLDKLKKK